MVIGVLLEMVEIFAKAFWVTYASIAIAKVLGGF